MLLATSSNWNLKRAVENHQRLLYLQCFKVSIFNQSIQCIENMLYVNLNDKEHAIYFYNKRGGSETGASITSFQIPQSLADEIKNNAVPQAQGKQFPNSHQISDPTKSNSAYGLPKTYIDKLTQQAVQGSGKTETPQH